MEEEKKIPTKEEIVALLQEQIEVKTFQLQLQELNEKLAKSKAGELQALEFIGNMTNPQQEKADAEEYTLTEDDIKNNPELAEQGFKAGDDIMVPKQRKLKKDK